MLFRFSQGQSFGYLRGVVMILLGLTLLFSPEFTLVSIARLVATLFIVKGALAGISLLLSRGEQRNPELLLECIIDLGIGLLVLYNPGGTVSFFVVILAIWALLGGLLMAFSFNTLRRVGVTNWGLFMSSIIALSFGLVLLFEPLQGGVALATIIGAFSLVYGIANIISVASGRTM